MPLSTSDRSLAEPVIRRLNVLRPMSAEARQSLEYALLEALQRTRSGEDLISEGDAVDSVRLVLSGWLCRYKTLEDGRRQIVNFIFPGESCDAHAFLMPAIDHSIATMTPVVYAEIKRAHFESLVANHRSLAEAFLCETLVNAAIQREWAINLGRRVALERVAHLFCEIIERLRPVGMVDGNSCVMPITQTDLADATGLSVVHLNRTLQELRASGLIVLRERTLTINDLGALKNAALFSPSYLQLYRRG
ncbi:Crp/Fnr family transcriptional regulator [Bradyrhizobium sp. 182]|uniref:Crp/Fnr family transcriptional regulator n=1 Tax=unclassified Bradyrhizobium TaxID=2631580 RepID=UPI001FFB3170|nr:MULTISPECIES: Crp/Fnr family transcriptional regulator [unclassified Bradyrhizobium]MCK1419293.1 Crp/Fnr family transcriptional regulator [Bradyrhizobium sp. CW12]MCK1526954.1 Crp/Fnr family transcriptional regulator [Bradyrhizobium sp. 182]MCK1595377.1 Crp/Fnr family transcriptional regulator [Bradyrhizobium sp. 164]MCK1620294.1 Crp/Fnr family transcriptional regulator [Bradyrhizobium sp. 159]MCK1645296.1 Crp/Fnr family transcriptional regulator [Bradyrhizobium sp. 154]